MLTMFRQAQIVTSQKPDKLAPKNNLLKNITQLSEEDNEIYCSTAKLIGCHQSIMFAK